MPERSRRLRILAGPNGSGKSTIVKKIRSNYYCGYFVNADEIQVILDDKKVLNLNSNYGLEVPLENFEKFLSMEGRSWQEKAAKENTPINIFFSDNNIVIREGYLTGIYDAAIVADFIRLELLAQNNTFTFETVLSHPSKLDFLKDARLRGYKNYLYFVCTVSPAINSDRVAQRVRLGGHGVPSEKIESRYYASLALLSDLIPHTYHTYLFDNSFDDSEIKLVAEIENGSTFIPKTEEIPWWVDEYVLGKLFS
ncbi:MAG: toxin [Bacteroidota bacterium]|nr:toxin [Bacteroidota bacterium]